jgi:transposase, IS5 family
VRLCKSIVIDKLIEMFESLRDQGLEAHGGQIIDDTFVTDPKHRNSRQEIKEIKANHLPDGWNERPKRL